MNLKMSQLKQALLAFMVLVLVFATIPTATFAKGNTIKSENLSASSVYNIGTLDEQLEFLFTKVFTKKDGKYVLNVDAAPCPYSHLYGGKLSIAARSI
jgi:hypothetical protein